jgi:signal transduction histidine kinase
VYELLSNTMQHAKAKQVLVHARCKKIRNTDMAAEQELTLTLSDDGQGLPADHDWSRAQLSGQGLRGMGERVQAIGARWHICASGSSLEHGCALRGAAIQLKWEIQ